MQSLGGHLASTDGYFIVRSIRSIAAQHAAQVRIGAYRLAVQHSVVVHVLLLSMPLEINVAGVIWKAFCSQELILHSLMLSPLLNQSKHCPGHALD